MTSTSERTADDAPWAALSTTSRTVALEVLLHGPLSRSELARRLDLSAGTLTRLAVPLLEAGLLTEGDGPHETAAGRPARPLQVVADAEHFVGVRLTGDEATAVRTDLRARSLATASAPLPDPSPAAVVAAVAALVQEVAPDVDAVAAVGVALGGQVRDRSHVVRAPFLGWSDEPLADRVAAATGRPTTVENDIVALTTAEHWFGAGTGRPDLALVTVGSGIGVGLVARGHVAAGPDAGVGLMGHTPLGLAGPLCEEGHRGCAAGVLTDASLLSQASLALGRPVTRHDLEEVAAAPGHPAVRRLVEEFAVGLGRLVALVANVSMVPFVVVSGEGVDLAEVVQARVRAEVVAHREAAAQPLELLFRRCPPTEWARGAAAVAIQRHVLAGSSPR